CSPRVPEIRQTRRTSCAGSQCRPIGRSDPRHEAGPDNLPYRYAPRPPVPESACARCLPRFPPYRCGSSSPCQTVADKEFRSRDMIGGQGCIRGSRGDWHEITVFVADIMSLAVAPAYPAYIADVV